MPNAMASSVQLYHAIVVHKLDEHMISWHIDSTAPLRLPILGRCCYYATDRKGRAPECREPYQVLPVLEMYENLPVKTYSMIQHALTVPGWTHLLKADVNSYPVVVDLEAVARQHLTGFCSYRGGSRVSHIPRVYQRALAEPYMQCMPTRWCGGPCYAISRLLAHKIVERGVWYARSWPFEDVMVSKIAMESGFQPGPGIAYWSDGCAHYQPVQNQ